LICKGEEYKLSDGFISDSEHEEFDYEKTFDHDSEHKCLCKIKFESAKLNFFNRYIKKLPNLIDRNLKIQYSELSSELPKTDLCPSMYPYIKGITRINEYCQTPYDNDMIFQWLPSEFYVTYEGDQINTSINSYINNLTDKRLETPISKIFSKFVPHFNNLFETLYSDNIIENKIKLESCQVIVEAQELVLDGSNTSKSYKMGSWHFEGTKYEHIIATGIYYYDNTNIKQIDINFRVKIENPENIYYPLNCPEYLKTHYGLISDCSYINIGSIKTEEDLCFIFPNIMQRQDGRISLINKNLNGNCKILIFYVVDPHKRILSTADIANQQEYITQSEAKTYRDILMFERKCEITIQDSVFEHGLSLGV